MADKKAIEKKYTYTLKTTEELKEGQTYLVKIELDKRIKVV